MKVILYTTHCPQCMGVEELLKEKNIDYIENDNIDEIKATGYSHVPLLEVDGKILSGVEIYTWASTYKEDNNIEECESCKL